MNDRRAPRPDVLIRKPNGEIWNESTLRGYLSDLDRRAPKLATVARLSKADPFCQEVEATARGIRAERAA